MWNSKSSVVLLLASHCFGLDLRALPEYFRPDPFGGIVLSDRPGAVWLDAVKLPAARDGYRSFHLVAKTDGAADCRLSIDLPLTTDLYREWFHLNLPDGKYYPDALIPVRSPYTLQASDAENRIAGQTAQAFLGGCLDSRVHRTKGVSRAGPAGMRLRAESGAAGTHCIAGGHSRGGRGDSGSADDLVHWFP